MQFDLLMSFEPSRALKVLSTFLCVNELSVHQVQGGAELTDTFWYAIICLIAGKHWNKAHQFYVQRMQFYYLWWITSWRWATWLRVNCLRQSTKLSKPLCNTFWSSLVRTFSFLIARFMSSVMSERVLYTHSFRYPHRKKCGNVVGGERAGHAMTGQRVELGCNVRKGTEYFESS
jgi:hypothetical protein